MDETIDQTAQPQEVPTKEPEKVTEKEAEAANEKKVEDAPKKSKPKRLFVGNVAKTVDQERFTKHFEQYGELKDIVLMKHRDEKEHRSFGFVSYVDGEAADKVLNMEHVLDGRVLNINNATKRTRKFHLKWGRIPKTITKECLEAYFKKFGEIEETVCFRDRGYGFITMVQEDNNFKEIEDTENHLVDVDGELFKITVTVARQNFTGSRGRGGYTWGPGFSQAGAYGYGGFAAPFIHPYYAMGFGRGAYGAYGRGVAFRPY